MLIFLQKLLNRPFLTFFQQLLLGSDSDSSGVKLVVVAERLHPISSERLARWQENMALLGRRSLVSNLHGSPLDGLCTACAVSQLCN